MLMINMKHGLVILKMIDSTTCGLERQRLIDVYEVDRHVDCNTGE